jgi:short-subunit dehydrogenase
MDLNSNKYGPWALVVGGSEGVGAAFSRKLAAQGFKLILVARKVEPLEELATELRAGGAEVRVLSADLSKADVLAKVRAVTDDVEIGLLVYNAGANNTRGNFVELPAQVTDSVIAINVLGQVSFARHYGALMCQRRRGGIILTGSLGGYLGSPTLAAYTASKAFSRIFSEALWGECTAFGVDVLHLNIGFTATPAMARLGMDISVAEPPENVAQQGLDNIANGPVWIVTTKGNLERVRRISVVEDRATVVRSFAIPPREESGRQQILQKQLADKG